jgi:putative component of membrane protein insertase Oxa1/YidC/SpoIIIJ protein YidD
MYRVMSLVVFFILLHGFSQCYGQDRVPEEAWEPEDLKNLATPEPRLPNPARLFTDCAIDLIGFYQSSISPSSIQRCPFYPSCSNFTLQAIKRYGFLKGVCLFIDRNLYRENSDIMNHYDFIRLPSGILKLDDRIFLTGIE